MKKAELEAKGVNFDNLKELFGDLNIITQFWAAKQKETEDYGSYMCGGAASASYIGAA